MSNRNLVFLVLIFAAVFTPWWLVCALLVGTFLFYQDFFEGILVLFYLDLIYSGGLLGWRGAFLLTIGGLLFLLVVEICRKAMLVHD